MGNRDTNNAMSHFLGISLLLAFLLPHTTVWLMAVNPILCLLLEFSKSRKTHYSRNKMVVIPFVIILLLSILDDGVTFKGVFMCITILLYVACFPMVIGVKPPNVYLYLTLGAIVVSQFACIFSIPIISSFIEKFYPVLDVYQNSITDISSGVTMDSIYLYRLGGLYRNENNCARAVSMLMAFFIILNSNKSLRKIIVYCGICFGSIILTGSRTGFVVASVIAFAYMYYDKRIKSAWRYGILLLALIAFIIIMTKGSDTLRGLNVAQGLQDSANQKFTTFLYYLTHEESPIRLLFGYLDSSRFVSPGGVIMNYFDSDYGDVIFCYGFIGFFTLVIYYYKIFKCLRGIERVYYFILLWIISSTIFTAFRAFFIFMLLLSVIFTKGSEDTAVDTKLPSP